MLTLLWQLLARSKAMQRWQSKSTVSIYCRVGSLATLLPSHYEMLIQSNPNRVLCNVITALALINPCLLEDF